LSVIWGILANSGLRNRAFCWENGIFTAYKE